MRKVYGMSHKEIAARLEIATSTVEKHLLKGVGKSSKTRHQRFPSLASAACLALDH